MLRALRILCKVECPTVTVRMWDGSGGPYVDAEGDIWRACVLRDGALDAIESSINGEAFTLSLTISGVDQQLANALWQDYVSGDIIGSKSTVYIQKLNEYDQPVGTPIPKFSGTIANVTFDDVAESTGLTATCTIEVVNKFILRTLTSGVTYSDVDQRTKSLELNPTLPADRFCERIPGLAQKTRNWPNW